MQKKIIILALENIQNIGDELLGVTTQWLAKSVTSFKVERRQFTLSAKQAFKQGIIIGSCLFVCLRLSSVLFQKIGLFTMSFYLNKLAYHFKLYSYYKKIMKESHAIIVAIGMLKYSTQNFSYVFDELTAIANKYNIPVLFNAQSIQKGNNKDKRYLSLVKASNRSCVKMITTRDGQEGLSLLQQDYIRNPEIITDFVGDPALWIPEIFQIHKKTSDTIGIGLVRRNIYQSYGSNFSSEQLFSVYEQLIHELDIRNQKWVLFCNGMPDDYNFGKEILSRLNLADNKLLPAPKNSQQFIEMISGFKAVFGARLHACISSFALDIPIVGLLWDDKLKYFSKTMGVSDFFLTIEQLNGVTVANKLQEAISFTYDNENRSFYKEKTKELITYFLTNYVCNTEGKL